MASKRNFSESVVLEQYRVALENAASIAGMLLTTECVLAEIKEETPAAPAMPGGMPGMY